MGEVVGEAVKELAMLSPYALALGLTIAGLIVVNIFFLRQFRKLYSDTLKRNEEVRDRAMKTLEKTNEELRKTLRKEKKR